jgi:creatinine amidohydrolase/Fe(II)-dependent formamide hydrolase-like protein
MGNDFYSGIETAKLIAQRTDILVSPVLMVGQAPGGDASARQKRRPGGDAGVLRRGAQAQGHRKGTSAAEMSSTGSWSERDPRQASVDEGRRTVESAVNAAVAFIDRWKALRPMAR